MLVISCNEIAVTDVCGEESPERFWQVIFESTPFKEGLEFMSDGVVGCPIGVIQVLFQCDPPGYPPGGRWFI